MQTSKVGLAKLGIYFKIGLHVVWKYRKQMSFKTFLHASRLLFAFYHNKLIKLNDTYKLHIYLPAYPTEAFFTAVEGKLFTKEPKPVSVVFSITKACTGKCPHCYQHLDKGKDSSLKELQRTAKNLVKTGVSFINIEGGDAFLKMNELCAVLDIFKDKAEVWVNTTGLNVTKEKLQILKDKGMCGIMVSIHSQDEKVHNLFVGQKETFKQACQALDWCDELNIGSAINTVLEYPAIHNNDLPKIMEIAKKHKCGFVQLIHPKRAGLWLNNKALNEQDELIKQYVKKQHKYYNSRFAKDFPALPAQAEEEATNKFGCTSGGIDRFYIGESGELQPCEFLNISFGNINKERFDVVFKRMRNAFKYPCEDWLCATQAADIERLKEKYHQKLLPLPYEITKELIATWNRGKPTKIYKKIGLYQDE